MKSMTEMRDSATETAKTLMDGARKAGYAAVGAPKVASRRIAELAGRMGESATKEFEVWVTEGEKLTEQLRDRNMVDELKDRVDFDQLQDRVEALRDQLEDVLTNWRDNFMPQEEAAPAPAKKPAAAKKATTKSASSTSAKKPAAAKKSTAKTAAKKPATTKSKSS